MSNPSPKNPPVPAHAHGSKPAHEREPLIDDDLHVPKGLSRGAFLFLVGMMIFLLVIWLVPGPMLGISGGAKNRVVVRMTLPSGEKVEWRESDKIVYLRQIQDALTVDFFLGFQLGLDANKPESDDLMRLVVLDRIAQEAGVDVTDADLAEHLRSTLQFHRASDDDFIKAVAARGWDVHTVEETIRMLLRAARFQQLVGFAGAVPDPKKIEELWHQENAEFAFDYVALETASLREEARKELPDDAALEAWFGKLPDGEKEELKTAEKRTAELALFRDSETTPAAELLAAYPEKPPEGTAPTPPDEVANQYYNRVYPLRFKKQPAEGDDPTTPPGFFSFEEVKERCLADGPVYFALQRWIEDLNARRTNGETVDFTAEAEKLGLEHQAFLEPRVRTEYEADEAGGGQAVAEAVFESSADGSLYPGPVTLAQGLAVVRANTRTEPALPPFPSIRDTVAEKWLDPKAEELAKKRLAAVREGLERFEPAKKPEAAAPREKKSHYRATGEAFQAAAQAAGLTVKQRDYLNKAGPVTKDPLSSDEEHRTLSSQAGAFGLYELETDEVAEPGLSYDQKKVYLVRLAGKRDVPIDEMSPTQYDRFKQNARNEAITAIGKAMDLDFLRKHYGLWLWEDSAEYKAEQAKAEKEHAERAAKAKGGG